MGRRGSDLAAADHTAAIADHTGLAGRTAVAVHTAAAAVDRTDLGHIGAGLDRARSLRAEAGPGVAD